MKLSREETKALVFLFLTIAWGVIAFFLVSCSSPTGSCINQSFQIFYARGQAEINLKTKLMESWNCHSTGTTYDPYGNPIGNYSCERC